MRAAIQLLLITLAAATLGCTGWSESLPTPLRSSESSWWSDRHCGPNEALLEITEGGTVVERRCVPMEVIPLEVEEPSEPSVCSAPVEDPSCFCLANPAMPACATSGSAVPAEPGR